MSEVTFFGKQLKLNTADDAAEVVKAIEEADDIETLTLSGNTCGVEACKAIARALESKPSFKRAIWRDIFTGRLLEEIPQALEHLGKGVIASNARLVELDLSDNAFGPNGMKGLVDFLASPACFGLKTFTLNNVGLGIAGAKLLASSLLNCHRAAAGVGQKFALEEFTSGRNRLENEGAILLAEVFETLGSLVRVSMTQNGINYAGISTLIKALSKNPNLEVLDLNDNTFTVRGANAVAEAFPMLEHLRSVNFGDCLLRAEGAKVIAKSLQDHLPQLESLDLTCNEINGEAALAIATAVASKPSLKQLDLNGNSIGETNIELVRQVLEAKGHTDALGTLSSDEGSDSEEDADDNDEEESDDDGEGDEKKGDVSLEETLANGDRPKATDNSATSPAPSSTQIAALVEDYWKEPTREHLVMLPVEERTDLLTAKLKNSSEVTDSLETSLHFVRMTECCRIDDQSTNAPVFEVVDKIFREYLSNDDFISSFLQHMDLLKSEDKKFLPRPEAQREGPLVAMTQLAVISRLSAQQVKLLQLLFFKEESFINQHPTLKSYLHNTLKAYST